MSIVQLNVLFGGIDFGSKFSGLSNPSCEQNAKEHQCHVHTDCAVLLTCRGSSKRPHNYYLHNIYVVGTFNLKGRQREGTWPALSFSPTFPHYERRKSHLVFPPRHFSTFFFFFDPCLIFFVQIWGGQKGSFEGFERIIKRPVAYETFWVSLAPVLPNEFD